MSWSGLFETQFDASFDAIVIAPFGAVGIRTDGERISRLTFLPSATQARLPANRLAAKAVEQVQAYLADPAFSFDLPLAEAGTAFQQKVWEQIAMVPVGSTRSYGAIARHIRSAPRAVGQACGANPYPLITPCHRVIAASGEIGGFSGSADNANYLLEIKRWLLAHEGVIIRK